LLSGSGTFANSRLVSTMAGEGKGLVWTRLDTGPEIVVPLHDYVGKAVYFVGDIDRKVSATIERIVRRGDHVLDIGANLGVVSLRLSQLVGDTGIVHAFEPNPHISDLLSQSLDRNRFKNVRIHKCALGPEDGQLNLMVPSYNSGMATLSAAHTFGARDAIPVQVKTLSGLAGEIDLSNVRLVKIDVEGFELEMLRGARQWLATQPPEALLFESNEICTGDKPDGVVSFLAELGYEFFSIPRRLFSLQLSRFKIGDAKSVSSHDMLAIRKNSVASITSSFDLLPS